MIKVIGFDLDGVLYPWQEACVSYLKHYHNFTGEVWELFDEFGNSEYFKSKGELFMKNMIRIEHIYNTRPPSIQQIEFMKSLAKDYEIVYITSRPPEVEFATRRYLTSNHYPYAENVIFSRSKPVDVRLVDCDIYVEDRVKEYLALERVVKTVLFKRPWNKGIWDKVEYKINDLTELREYLN